MVKSIEIIDLGINNLNSVIKSFSINAEKVVVRSSGGVSNEDKLIVLPGLGKFASGMDALQKNNLTHYLQKQKCEGIPIIGICLGMQLLGDGSDESPNVTGLGLISGISRKLNVSRTARIPHISWAETKLIKDAHLFPSLDSNRDFYFVHSYSFIPNNKDSLLSETNFGNSKFVSSVREKNVIGFQFHPEKSGLAGRDLISDVLAWSSHET